MSEPYVLVVEDEAEVRKHLVRALRRESIVVDEAGDGEAGRVLFEKRLHPVVLLDLRMPKLDGMALLEIIHRLQPETQVIILSGHGTMKDAVRALNLHAAAYLEKPPNLTEILAAVQTAWAEYQERVGVAPEPPAPAEEPPPELSEVRRILSEIPPTEFLDEKE